MSTTHFTLKELDSFKTLPMQIVLKVLYAKLHAQYWTYSNPYQFLAIKFIHITSLNCYHKVHNLKNYIQIIGFFFLK